MRYSLPAGLEHPSDFSKTDNGPLDAAKDQRRHRRIERVVGKGQMLDVGGSQSDVSIRSGSRQRDGLFVELGRNDAGIARVMIEIRPTARANFQHEAAHILQQAAAPIADKGNVTGAAHARYSTIGAAELHASYE